MKKEIEKKEKEIVGQAPNDRAEKKENPLLNLGLNIVIPAIVLFKFSKPEYLGALGGLLVALAFPLGYGLYDFIGRKKANFFSILGFVSIFLTGIIGVFRFPSEWIAVKEAAVPLLFGVAVLVSLRTPFPLVRKLLYSKELFAVEQIEQKLGEKGNLKAFEQLLRRATYGLAGSFGVSAVLNFLLAKWIVKSPAGTVAFNEELGKLTALSYPVIALPSTLLMVVVVWYVFRQLKKLTGLDTDGLFAEKFSN